MDRKGPLRAMVVTPGYPSYEAEREVLADFGGGVAELDWGGDRARLAAGLAEADLVFVRDSPLDAAAIGAMRRARGIVRYGVGIDNIDLEAARARRIPVANVPDYGAEIEVSDHAAALLLALARRVASRDRRVRRGVWGAVEREPIRRIAGSTLGLVGYGRIARALHARLLPFGIARTLVHDPYADAGLIAAAGAEAATLEVLFAESDVISLHAPATPATRRLVGEALLARVRPGALLVNTARGALVDEGALVRALSDGRLGGAALDVLDPEPPAADSPLLALDNVVVTDHIAWYS
jgi:D-3-phosphoglycerate dehydrogenase / 2-oxoglutarate reductase